MVINFFVRPKTKTYTHAHTHAHTLKYRPIGLVGRVFANGTENRGSIPGRVIPKTQKMVPETSLPNTQNYKSNVEQSREKSSAHFYTLGVIANEKGAIGSPSITVANTGV